MSPVELAAGAARATIALRGAEITRWRAAGTDLLWSADPAWWPRTAPVLFPIVGRVRGGELRVGDVAYPMGVHGFAAAQRFTVEATASSEATFVLRDDETSRAVFPFPFRLSITYALGEATLETRCEVHNPGDVPLPYALGLHPGFRWPFAGGRKEDYAIAFARPERPEVPVITPDGLFSAEERQVPLQGRLLPVDDRLFSREALCFLDAVSRSLAFRRGENGPAIHVEVEDFPHWALWTKPGAPFLSIEAWTGHGDPHDFSGDIREKPSMRLLPPGATARHRATFRFEGGTDDP